MQSGDIVGKIVKSRMFDVQWQVENFASLDSTPDTVFYSPTFADPSGLTRWSLEVYPGGTRPRATSPRQRVNVAVFVVLESPGPVLAKLCCSVLNASGLLRFTQCPDQAVLFTVGDNAIGFPEFLPRGALLTALRTELLPQGHLTIHCRVSIKELRLESRYPAVPGHNLSALRYNRSYDLTLVAGTDEFRTHRLVLTTVSPVFAAMFEHDTKERTEARVVIEDTKPHVLALLLDFAYDGFLELNDDTEQMMDTIEALILAADKYQIESLRQLCTRQLASRLSPDTATRLLLIADRIHLSHLYADVLQVVKSDSYRVMTSSAWIDALDTHTVTIKKALRALADMESVATSKTPTPSTTDSCTKAESEEDDSSMGRSTRRSSKRLKKSLSNTADA